MCHIVFFLILLFCRFQGQSPGKKQTFEFIRHRPVTYIVKFGKSNIVLILSDPVFSFFLILLLCRFQGESPSKKQTFEFLRH